MSSGFISEAEIADQRKLRQQEWERVRTADRSTSRLLSFLLFRIMKF